MSAITHRVKITCLACRTVLIVHRREGEPMIACSNAITATKQAHRRACVPNDVIFTVETEVVR